MAHGDPAQSASGIVLHLLRAMPGSGMRWRPASGIVTGCIDHQSYPFWA